MAAIMTAIEINLDMCKFSPFSYSVVNFQKFNAKAHSVEISAFFIIQILREINFGDSRSAKSAISLHFEALNFDFYAFLHILKVEISQISKIQKPKSGSFRTSRFSKIDFT